MVGNEKKPNGFNTDTQVSTGVFATHASKTGEIVMKQVMLSLLAVGLIIGTCASCNREEQKKEANK